MALADAMPYDTLVESVFLCLTNIHSGAAAELLTRAAAAAAGLLGVGPRMCGGCSSRLRPVLCVCRPCEPSVPVTHISHVSSIRVVNRAARLHATEAGTGGPTLTCE